MIDFRGFLGILDTDNSPTEVVKGSHIMANNGRFKGVNGVLRFENVEGTRQINYVQPSGTNTCIGAFFSVTDKLLYWFLHNSNNNHSIQVLDTATETVTQILQSNFNTDGDILRFNLNNPIHSVDILYGSDANFLVYVDSNGIPTEINLTLFQTTPYTLTKREFIDVAKAPFVMPPKVAYENDNNTTVNNLKNSLFQFCARPVYNNNEKPVYSSGSEVPLPYLPFDQNISKDATKNSRIGIYIQTGDVNVKAIEIAGRKVQNGVVSDWVKIVALNKIDLGIPSNSIYKFLFYNDSAYPIIPTEGTSNDTQVLNLQDYVPQKANAQSLLNGNVLGYAGITEGYDKVNANIQIVPVVDGNGRANNKNGINFFAAQNSLFSIGTGNQITIYLSGVGVNDGTTNQPVNLSNSLNTRFEVKAQDANQIDKSFFYFSSVTTETITSILTGLSAAAVAIGYTQVSLISNVLVLSYPNITLLSSQTRTTQASDKNEAVYVNAERAAYAYGIQYFDSKGRTNGVTYGATVNTQPETTTTNLFELRIFHRPPIWATYYNVVRSNNNTYSKLLTWISDSAFSNQSAINTDVYGYIGIGSIKEYNEEISSTSGVVSYEFNKGDRIRFVSRYLFDGTIDNTGYANLDYEVLGTVENPVVNGVVKNGTFIKILYPASDISADFKLDGSDAFQNYKIVLYGQADRTDKDLEFFYEFGQQYGIGNAGSLNAYHAGMIQSQTPSLSQPAKILIDKGDFFFRYRNVVAGIPYTATGGGDQRFGDLYRTPRIRFATEPVTTQYELHNNSGLTSAGLTNSDYPNYSNNDEIFFNKTTNPANFKIKATITLGINNDTSVDIYLKNVTSAGVVTLNHLVTGLEIPGGSGYTTRDIIIDGIFLVQPNSKLWLLIGNSTQSNYLVINTFEIDYEVLEYTNTSVVEKSFNDYYDIEISANSRVTVIDENAAKIYYPTKFRWGLGYLQDTNINNVNRFYADNYDEWDRAKGDVRRLKVRERLLKVFQTKATGQTGIYSKFVQDSGGTNLLTTTDDIITKNNINYYEGEYGIGDYPTSLVSTDAADIFVDHITGEQIVSDNSGLRTLGSLYLGQYYIRSLLTKYNKTWTKPDGSRANILGVYNYIDEEYNCLLQGGTNGNSTILDYNFSFNFKRKGYSSFFDWHPEWAISANEKIYSWKNGNLYVHDNVSTNKYCNFYNSAYACNITLPFNDSVFGKKGWKGMVELSNVIWTCPQIYTDIISYGNLFQESNLITTDFTLKEGMFHASFLRDKNSVNGISGGDVLKGNYIVVKFQPSDSSNLVFLAGVSVKYLNSALIPS